MRDDLIERLNRCADTCEVYSPDQCATLIDGIGHLAMRHLLREAAAALEAAREDGKKYARPAGECPHRTRCDCLAGCKWGFADGGAK